MIDLDPHALSAILAIAVSILVLLMQIDHSPGKTK
jgi:hypothetical protein